MFFGRVKGEREGDDDSEFPPPPTPPPPEEEADSILAALAKVMGNQEITHIAEEVRGTWRSRSIHWSTCGSACVGVAEVLE